MALGLLVKLPAITRYNRGWVADGDGFAIGDGVMGDDAICGDDTGGVTSDGGVDSTVVSGSMVRGAVSGMVSQPSTEGWSVKELSNDTMSFEKSTTGVPISIIRLPISNNPNVIKIINVSPINKAIPVFAQLNVYVFFSVNAFPTPSSNANSLSTEDCFV